MTGRRVKFERGKQNKFIIAALSYCAGVDALAKSLHVSPRTIRDWRREKFLISNKAMNYIQQKFLRDHGFHVRASRGIDLRIESKSGIKHYMQLIGTHNLKHLNRYRK